MESNLFLGGRRQLATGKEVIDVDGSGSDDREMNLERPLSEDETADVRQPAAPRALLRRSVVAISGLVAFVLATQAAALAVFGRTHIVADIESRAHGYAALAVGPLCEAYQTYFASGLSKFRELVSETASLNSDLEELAIFDTEANQLFNSRELTGDHEDMVFPTVEDQERLAAAVRGLETQSWVQTNTQGQRRFIVVAPYVEQWGRHRFSVAFSMSYAGAETAVRGVAGRILLLALFALALGVGCAYLLSAQSLRPLEELTRGARRMADGRLDHRIALSSKDEFELLSTTLDGMAEKLSTTIADLEGSNERLADLNRELQEIDRTKSDLLANVSHELRTPLTAISGYVEALQSGLLGQLSSTQGQSLEVVERNIRRLRAMIDQLLSYSRMESGKLDIELRPFDVEAIARHVVEGLYAVHGSDLDLNFETRTSLPEVYGDASRISQVIENLLTNAIKFSPNGERIDLALVEVPGGVEVVVEDHGPGIPVEVQAKIFDRFYQVDASSKRKFGGMGLGLAIVKEILELHHSQISVDSAPNEGATFRFVLPAAAERTGVFPIVGRKRVAIIDDDAGFVQATASALSRRGYVIDAAATAEQGIALVQRVLPDLIILDRLLPDRDGFDVVTDLKGQEKCRHIPIVLATVRSEEALGIRLGAAAYLVKPVDSDEMARVVGGLIGQPQSVEGAETEPDAGVSGTPEKDVAE